MSAPLLELTDATVLLGEARVLDRLTLSIHAGEHTALLGPNGSGKSTLMKLLTLQLYPLAAENGAAPIRVFGRDRWDVFALRSQLGIVSADLHDRFVHGNSNGVISGLEAVLSGFFASHGVFAHQRVTAAMRQKASDALERVGAAHLAMTPLATMSTGEARRVLIARALAHRPKALVLDEPTRGLDLVARHHFMEQIRGLARQGVTLLLVTHHVDEIIPEIARVILLQRGRVARDGPKTAVLTAASLGFVFEAPLVVETVDGYYDVKLKTEKSKLKSKR
ncbi:MAG: ATP-binding cassette domain-containing protein [Acidobacteria bacterium]|nr:ATP-binding cassette domain-containing protein [Acidobacteriota bacterium]